MSVKFSNNGHSTLAASLSSSATSITVASGHGARFPSLSSGEYFYATLIDASNNLEIVKVTARSSDVLTATRAQESTTARAYAIGDRIELRVTAQGLIDIGGSVADDAVATAKIADDAVTAAKVNDDLISGQTALTSEPADTDEFLVSDAGTLKKLDYSLIKSASGKIAKVHWWWDNTQATIPSCSGGSSTGLTIHSANFTAAVDNPFFSLTTNLFIGLGSNGNDAGDIYQYAYIEKAGSVKYRFGFYKASGQRSNATFAAAAGNYFLDESDAGIYSNTAAWGGHKQTNANIWGNNSSGGNVNSNQPAQTSGIASGDTLTLVIRIGGSGGTYYNRTQGQVNSISRSMFELRQWSSM